MKHMKHIKLFENFDYPEGTLKPDYVTKPGETALMIFDGDGFNVTVMNDSEVASFKKKVLAAYSNEELYTSDVAQGIKFYSARKPGIAYVCINVLDHNDPNMDDLGLNITFENENFESSTPNYFYWVTGPDRNGEIENPNAGELSGNAENSTVFILKKGKVLSTGPGSQFWSSEMTIDEYLRSIETV